MNPLLAILGFGLLATNGPASALTYPDLLRRVNDLEQLAVLPAAGETCAQWSSVDRKSRYDETTGRYVDWFANNDGRGFIREESGQQVLAEMTGPGCLWRIWSATPEKGHVRIYLDGAAEPVLDSAFADYFATGGLCGLPALIYKTAANGFNLRVPIPYQKSCKIVADPGWGNYFQFTYTTFPPGTTVPTFSRRLLGEHFSQLQDLDADLGAGLGLDPAGALEKEKTIARTLTLQPGQTAAAAEIAGPRALTSFKVRLETNGLAEVETALRAVTLSMRWDGEAHPSVWSPLGDFFGTAPGLNAYRSLPLGLTGDGFYSYWYMPFATSALVEFRNEGNVPVTLECRVTHAALTRPARELGRFHAKWHRDALLPAEPERDRDWTVLKTTGRGRFCGVALHVWNPRGEWWGEGDEKFFVDGEKFPSTIGTGSEDYFGYAWSSPALFSLALHGQTRNDGASRGHLSLNRWHLADNVPFQTSFEAALEKYFPNARPTLYDCVAYWYQEGGEDPYGPCPLAERIGIYPDLTPARVPGAIEGEILRVTGKSGGAAAPQEMQSYHGAWSGGRQLLWNRDVHVGDRLTLALPVPNAGRFAVAAQLTKAIDYGIIQLWIDGQKLGTPIDGFHDGVVPSGEIALGTCELTAGEHALVIECTGQNPKATGRLAGLDYLKLVPGE